MRPIRPVRVYTIFGPDTLALPKVAQFIGQEVELVIRRVPTLEEVHAANAGIVGSMADQIIADREDRG